MNRADFDELLVDVESKPLMRAPVPRKRPWLRKETEEAEVSSDPSHISFSGRGFSAGSRENTVVAISLARWSRLRCLAGARKAAFIAAEIH
jgi:hypothetical protein